MWEIDGMGENNKSYTTIARLQRSVVLQKGLYSCVFFMLRTRVRGATM